MDVSQLPDFDDPVWQAAFEVTKDTRDIKSQNRKRDAHDRYINRLCITDDPHNDIYKAGTIREISFQQDSSGTVSYTTTNVYEDGCFSPQPGPNGETGQFVTQVQCV